MNPEQSKNVVMYSLGYVTNVNYLILFLMLSIYVDFDVNPFYSLLYWGIGGLISVLWSYRIIQNVRLDGTDQSTAIIKLAVAHVPSLIGVFVGIIYLFMI